MKKVLLSSILFVTLSLSQTQPGATFLLIPPSARATAMAYAFTAISDDAHANYYNGAGFAFQESPAITVSYLGYLTGLSPDQHYAYFGMSFPLVNSAWGFEFAFFTPDEVEKRNFEGVYIGTELVWRIAPKISYARRVSDHMSLGIAWKFVYERYVWDPRWLGWVSTNGKSWAFDFSVLYRPLHNLSIGAVLHNIGPDINYTDEYPGTDPLPRLCRLGVAYVPVHNKYIKCTLSGEITKMLVSMFANEENTFWENLKYEFDEAWKAIGLELALYGIFSLRAGYFYDCEGKREGITFGMGIAVKSFALDIGIDEDIFDFPTQNSTVSISYRF
jgi:hypothetical protein